MLQLRLMDRANEGLAIRHGQLYCSHCNNNVGSAKQSMQTHADSQKDQELKSKAAANYRDSERLRRTLETPRIPPATRTRRGFSQILLRPGTNIINILTPKKPTNIEKKISTLACGAYPRCHTLLCDRTPLRAHAQHVRTQLSSPH